MFIDDSLFYFKRDYAFSLETDPEIDRTQFEVVIEMSLDMDFTKRLTFNFLDAFG